MTDGRLLDARLGMDAMTGTQDTTHHHPRPSMSSFTMNVHEFSILHDTNRKDQPNNKFMEQIKVVGDEIVLDREIDIHNRVVMIHW